LQQQYSQQQKTPQPTENIKAEKNRTTKPKNYATEKPTANGIKRLSTTVFGQY